MRGIIAVLPLTLLLALPAPAMAKGIPLTDAQMEDIAALPDDPEPTGEAGLSEEAASIASVAAQRGTLIASVAAQRAVEKRPVLYFVIPFSIAISIMGARELWLNIVVPWQKRRKLHDTPEPSEGAEVAAVRTLSFEQRPRIRSRG